MNSLLEIKDLSIEIHADRQKYNIVKNVNLSVGKKQKYGIVGESGSGKSITALSIMNLLPDALDISSGSIVLEGNKDLTNLSKKEMLKVRGNEISMIFQEPMTALDPLFQIEHQIQEVLRFHGQNNKQQLRELTLDMLNKVGISRPKQIMKEYPHQLSGGMRQRIMIAIALICNPKMIIADEPTTALDVTIQAQILDLMNELAEKNDTALLMITHDLGVIAETCERVAVMYSGEVVEETSVVNLFKNPAHPYTKGLIKSVKSLGDRSQRLYSIPGTVPTPKQFKRGCRFASRCPYVMEICKQQDPPFVSVGSSHKSRCWLHVEDGVVNG